MTQNIFIYTVGVNGKRESTILTKAMFSINKVVRIYYSTSFDESQQGFLRLSPDVDQQLILVERLHGFRPKPELLYASKDECHVIRFSLTGCYAESIGIKPKSIIWICINALWILNARNSKKR